MKKIIGVIVLLVIVGGVGYGGFYLWEKRYEYFFKGASIETVENDDIAMMDEVDDGSSDNSKYGNNEDNDNDDEVDVEDYFAPRIHKFDCDNECESRKPVESEYQYCREVCGLNEIREEIIEEVAETNNGCSSIKDGFKQDTCWKEKAVQEKNAVYCEEISDEYMSKICEDRVLEEIMN